MVDAVPSTPAAATRTRLRLTAAESEDPRLRAAFLRAFGETGPRAADPLAFGTGDDWWRWLRDPECPASSGAPSPFRRLRTANAALYRPGTAAAAVDAYRVLESAVEQRSTQAADALDAARRAVADPEEPAANPSEPAERATPADASAAPVRHRSRRVVGASLLVLLVLAVGALVTARSDPPRPRPAASVAASPVLVPPAEAAVLVTGAMAAATAPGSSGGMQLFTGERARFFNDVDASGDRLAGTRIGTDAPTLGTVDGGSLRTGQRYARGVRLAIGHPSPSVLVVGITQSRAAAWSAAVVVDSGSGGRLRTELRIAGSASAGLLQFATVPLPADVTAVRLTLTGRAPLVWQTVARP